MFSFSVSGLVVMSAELEMLADGILTDRTPSAPGLKFWGFRVNSGFRVQGLRLRDVEG